MLWSFADPVTVDETELIVKVRLWSFADPAAIGETELIVKVKFRSLWL